MGKPKGIMLAVSYICQRAGYRAGVMRWMDYGILYKAGPLISF
jgi:hypothetical protein